MRKLKESAVEKILKKAGGVFGDKGFIGTDYITTPGVRLWVSSRGSFSAWARACSPIC
jgi:hypothetical protein